MKRLALESFYLRHGSNAVIGCDEVGRGCLAGPVIAAAVSFVKPKRIPAWWKFVADSKTLKPADRIELAQYIRESAVWGIGSVSPRRIDAINIHHASLQAMTAAANHVAKQLQSKNALLLIDGKFQLPKWEYSQQAIVKGDSLVHSIAAASIIAKVYRDTLMEKLDRKFPDYRFAAHKGYGTKMHLDAIQQHGLTTVHRLSFCGKMR